MCFLANVLKIKKRKKMYFLKNHFTFPDCKKEINIHNPFTKADWEQATSITFGNVSNPKVTIHGQHHQDKDHDDILYMSFLINDYSLRPKDTVILCINSKKAYESISENDQLNINSKNVYESLYKKNKLSINSKDVNEALSENAQLKYDVKLNNGTGKLICSEYDNKNKKWVDLPTPDYIDFDIKEDNSDRYWRALIKINFKDLESKGINPLYFGFYLKIQDYTNPFDFTPYAWPIITDMDENIPNFIPPQEYWGTGSFIKNIGYREIDGQRYEKYLNELKVA